MNQGADKEVRVPTMLLLQKAVDLESQLIMTAAKNGELYSELLEGAVRAGKVKKSTLVDRKQALLNLGLISQEYIKNGGRGRPKMRLFMNNTNRHRFEELFGKPI